MAARHTASWFTRKAAKPNTDCSSLARPSELAEVVKGGETWDRRYREEYLGPTSSLQEIAFQVYRRLHFRFTGACISGSEYMSDPAKHAKNQQVAEEQIGAVSRDT